MATAGSIAPRKTVEFLTAPDTGMGPAVAQAAQESGVDLAPIPPETLDLWKGTGSIDAGLGGTAGTNAAADKPWGLWPYILLLLLLVAVAESVVADGFLRPSAPQRDEMKREAA